MAGYTYRCIVSGTCAPAATSGSAPLNFNTAPSVSADPSAATICAGANTSFAVTASGTSLTYQWQEDQGSGFSNVSNGGVYSTATTATLNITAATSGMNTYQYRCIVSGTCSPAATSNAAALTINTAPSVSVDPSAATICNNGSTTFSVTATGTALTYQWQEDQGSGFSNVSNGGVYSTATTATLTLTAAPNTMAGYA